MKSATRGVADASAPLWVFYDGECLLCSRVVAWALAHDRHEALRPEPYQSPLAGAMLGDLRARAADELIVWTEHEGVSTGSNAVAAMLARLPGWSFVAALLTWPVVRPVARAGYRWFAANRRWFGSQVCALPRAEGSPRNDSNVGN